ncbi:MAG: hypothetical protein ACXWD3_18805 [Mycobacterium sp.]
MLTVKFGLIRQESWTKSPHDVSSSFNVEYATPFGSGVFPDA